MKKNMVLKYNIVAIEIKLFTRASSRGSSEQKIIGAKKLYFKKKNYIFFKFKLYKANFKKKVILQSFILIGSLFYFF